MCLAHGRTQNNMREWLSWWSTTLPRSGPRVRVPSRALFKNCGNLEKLSVSTFFVSFKICRHLYHLVDSGFAGFFFCSNRIFNSTQTTFIYRIFVTATLTVYRRCRHCRQCRQPPFIRRLQSIRMSRHWLTGHIYMPKWYLDSHDPTFHEWNQWEHHLHLIYLHMSCASYV